MNIPFIDFIHSILMNAYVLKMLNQIKISKFENLNSYLFKFDHDFK
jgi:hypothetical protein